MHAAAWVIHQDTPDQYHVIESVQTPLGRSRALLAASASNTWKLCEQWWARGDSNARPLPCQGSALNPSRFPAAEKLPEARI